MYDCYVWEREKQTLKKEEKKKLKLKLKLKKKMGCTHRGEGGPFETNVRALYIMAHARMREKEK